MNEYKAVATLSHDKGTTPITVKMPNCVSIFEATQRAVRLICFSEGCPESAIVKIEVSLKKYLAKV